MRLIDHLKTVDKTVAAFAADIGEPETTVRKIVYGQRQPSLPLAVKIAAATGGNVSEADLMLQQQDAAA
ncbi:MAG: helix-turn-helix transcriptional regulator [Sphingobium sp.]